MIMSLCGKIGKKYEDMRLNEIPKFVLNLEKRIDRLEHIQKEMSYIGWDYELFKAVDTGCHLGCTLSHVGIIDIAIERNYEYVMVIEDDCSFMPYAKSFIKELEIELENTEFGILNLSPTHNRPVNVSNNHKLLIDITNFPPKEERHRGVFATNMIIYHKSIYDNVKQINLSMCIENQTIGFIENAYNDIFNVKRQFSIGKYRVDLCFIDYKLVIECDENNHNDRDPIKEKEREDYIISQGNRIIRYNPNIENFDLSNVIGIILRLISKIV
jgi:very-short-patch-repair endonuclease